MLNSRHELVEQPGTTQSVTFIHQEKAEHQKLPLSQNNIKAPLNPITHHLVSSNTPFTGEQRRETIRQQEKELGK